MIYFIYFSIIQVMILRSVSKNEIYDHFHEEKILLDIINLLHLLV